jgi:DNA-binding transcriptional MerR regulator
LKINEIAQRVGITSKNIRFYEQEGLLTPLRNRENGYRDYGAAEEIALRRIKLMRKLGLPLEDIRQMQQGRLTLTEGMRRRMADLERLRRDLDVAESFCQQLQSDGSAFDALDADRWLREMELKEKEGTSFMDRQKQDQRERSQGAILAAIAFALLMAAVIAFIIWADFYDPIPIWIVLALIALCLIPVVGVALALKQRLKEIKGGEEDAARYY